MDVAVARMEQNEASVQSVGVHILLPTNDYARLMYYLNCISCCYPSINSEVSAHLTDYENYSRLTAAEQSSVVSFAERYNPDKIPAFWEVVNLPDSNNKFVDIEEAKFQFAAAAAISSSVSLSLAAGEIQCVAAKVMVYTPAWIQIYYYSPLQLIRKQRLQQQHQTRPTHPIREWGHSKRGRCCIRWVVTYILLASVVTLLMLVINNTATPSPCKSSPCYNGGSCYTTETSYICFCPVGYTGRRCTTYVGDFIDCYDYYRNGSTIDGMYSVKPLNSDQRWLVYCEMSNGGWTRIQHRQDGSVNFNRNWYETKVGFGDPLNEHWLGNDAISYLTLQSTYEMRWDIIYTDLRSVTYAWRVFSVGSATTSYELTVSSALPSSDGVAEAFQEHHNFAQWSTKDVGWYPNMQCAVKYQGPWWYNNCYSSNLNNLYWHGGSCSDQCVADCICLDDNECTCDNNSTAAVTHTTIKIKRTCC